MYDLSRYRKAITALIGAVLIVVPVFLPENRQVEQVIQTVIAVATALGVYLVPNTE
jgi:hypothetical protein